MWAGLTADKFGPSRCLDRTSMQKRQRDSSTYRSSAELRFRFLSSSATHSLYSSRKTAYFKKLASQIRKPRSLVSSSMSLSLFFLIFFSSFPFSLSHQTLTLSSRFIHRFSDEVASYSGGIGSSHPAVVRRSREYYNVLNKWDVERQKRQIGNAKFQTLFPAEGGGTFALGNDFGWLHYTWIDIGTPNVSFLVALDAGSDLLWVPCDCIKCAPLSGYHGSLDKDLSVYNPSNSKTSRHLPCSHKLCDQGRSCRSPKQPCPYNVNYYTENTSTSGLLVEDILHLASSGGQTSVPAPVIFGCGRMQSGEFLEGIAPDGVLGLGLGDVSVPSILARSGLVHNSFSMCFQDDDSGRIIFGDRGVSNQTSSLFVPLGGKFLTYAVKVEEFCIKKKCLDNTNFQAVVDSGSSFTYLPNDIYRRISFEFDSQINASRYAYDDPSWEYCYEASQLGMPAVPSLTLILAVNKSFVISNPIFRFHDKQEEKVGFCLAFQPANQSVGIIGQNFMMGYRMVFDRESMELGWSRSDCRDLDNSKSSPLTPPSQNQTDGTQLPANEQQSAPNSHAVSPAVAGRTPNSVPSSAVHHVFNWFSCLSLLALSSVSMRGWYMFL